MLFTITFPSGPDGDRNVLAFVVDITERKQAQDALLAAQAELAHAARVATLGELSASIAHEVNQPLAAIVTSGEAGLRWLRRDVPDLKEVAATIGHVVAQGRRASEVVARIRTFLKKAPTQQDLLQIDEIIEEATLLVARELVKDDVILTRRDGAWPDADSRRPDPASAGAGQSAGQCRPGHVRPARFPHRHAARQSRRRRETSPSRSQDSGPGIRPDDMPHLFDPFFTTKRGGMGMGLAICRTTVEAHGGQLSVESTPGAGATFRLTLPYSQEHTLIMTRPDHVQPPAQSLNSVVIIVDDDAGHPCLARQPVPIRRPRYAPVRLAGRTAWRRRCPTAPAASCWTSAFPGVSGLDLQGQLVRQGISYPIIFMTGHGDIPMSVRAMKAGAVDFLSKPFRDQDMLDAVTAALERDAQHRAEAATKEDIRAQYETLTAREREVMGHVTAGLMNKQVAGLIGLSEITVKIHRGNVMRKMGVRSFADLVRKAEALGVSQTRRTTDQT